MWTGDDGFGDIEDPGCLTKEERRAICDLLDEPKLTENAYQFVSDLADMEESEPITPKQREWLNKLIERYV